MVKLTVKTLSNQIFHVEVEATATIAQCKAAIEASKGADFTAAAMKLIYAGKVLKDDQTLEGCKFKESDFLVCMMSKVKAKPKPAPAPSPAPAPAPAPMATSAPAPSPAPAPAPTSTEATTTAPPSTPAPAPAPAPSTDAETTTQDDTMSEAVKNLMDMGFPEDQVRSCLRAAFNNPDRAVEYLMNGIPAGLQAPAASTPAAGGGNTEAATPARAPTLDDLRNHPEFNQIKALVQQNPQALPEVLRQIGERQPQLLEVIHNNREAFVKMMNEPIEAPAPAPAGGAGAGATGGGAGGLAGMMAGGGAPDFQQLFSPENEAELAQALNMSPDQMGAITQMLRSLPPEQLQAMMQNMAGGGGMPGMPGMPGAGGPGGAPPGAVTIPLSQEEMASVNRLVELGFHRNEVIQVYLACDKNEEVAANFLFENGDTNMGMGGGDDAGAGGGDAGGAGGNGNDDMYS